MHRITRFTQDIFFTFLNSCVNAFDFKTRASRKEYISFTIVVVFLSALNVLLYSFIQSSYIKEFFIVIKILLLIPSLSLTIRRVHDLNISAGSFVLLNVIILYLWVKNVDFVDFKDIYNMNMSQTANILFYTIMILIKCALVCIKGTDDVNQYGSPPKN